MGKYYLAHHGVKGMKWGVRHASAKKFAKASKKFAKHPNRRNSRRMSRAADNWDQQQRILIAQNQSALDKFSRAYQTAQYYGLKTKDLRSAANSIKQLAKEAYKPIEKDPKYKDRGETFIGSLLDAVIGNEQKKDD